MTTSTYAARSVPNAINGLDNIDNIATTTDLRAYGVPERTIARRCRPGGPWRRLLPGVVMLSAGEPTRRQLLRAATAYLGGDAVISGADALRAHGLDPPVSRTLHLLVPAHRRIMPPDFLALERTSRLPTATWMSGLPFAPPGRAALDAARREPDPVRLRRLLAATVADGLSRIDDLRDELDAGNQRGSAAVRAELRRLAQHPEAGAHRAARLLIRRSPLPPPRWDTTVCDRDGHAIGTVDAWWDEIALGWQLGPPRSREPAGQQEYLALTAAGVVVVRTPYERLHTDAGTVLRELATAFRTAATRVRPPVHCRIRRAAA